MYDGHKAQVRTIGGDSTHFPIEVGLQQVSPLSPFLFTWVIEKLVRYTQGRCLDICYLQKTLS